MRISDWSSDVCSSDLPDIRSNARAATGPTNRTAAIGDSRPPHAIARGRSRPGQHSAPGTDDPNEVRPNRSEEHTSELQSLMSISYADFCLKKKKHINKKHQPTSKQQNKQSLHYNH